MWVFYHLIGSFTDGAGEVFLAFSENQGLVVVPPLMRVIFMLHSMKCWIGFALVVCYQARYLASWLERLRQKLQCMGINF